ncbi:hypothetical protein OsccyDRAFT_1545 [Leptolyngbyaceae cyanobacterium JSC-12]|jgi:predicted transcriptional regulator|nr:hypothetical protein OsccyDRAFT_1545 [Leptolyngbyaceae cyanobacterium JSC-12]
MRFKRTSSIARKLPFFLCVLCVFGVVLHSNTSVAQSQSSPTSQQQPFSIDWNTIAQVATALGVGVATVSIYASYRLYQLTRRDEYVNNLRKSILLNQERCSRLNALINYELTNEMANCVVYAKDLEIPLNEIFVNFFNPPSSEKEVELTKHIEESFPSITVPIHSPLIEVYDSIMFDISSDLALYQIESPGFYRVMFSLRTLFTIIERQIKKILRDEDIWKKILVNLLDRKDIQSFDKLRYILTNVFIAVIQDQYLRATQKDIDNLLGISSIVSNAYLSLTEDKLVRFSKLEKQQNLIPTYGTETITADLQEADKCLRLLLNEEDLKKYRELVVRFDERNRSGESS